MGDSPTHIVQDRVEEDVVHVLSLSDEEDPTSRPLASPPVSPRVRPTVFPMAAYSDVAHGLAKHPWSVHPANLARCIDAAFAIQQIRFVIIALSSLVSTHKQSYPLQGILS